MSLPLQNCYDKYYSKSGNAYTLFAELSLISWKTETECPEARRRILAVDRAAWCRVWWSAATWWVLLESWHTPSSRQLTTV